MNESSARNVVFHEMKPLKKCYDFKSWTIFEYSALVLTYSLVGANSCLVSELGFSFLARK